MMTTAASAQSDKAGQSDKAVTIRLFDGKTLDGWKKTEFLGCGDVKVEDGAIVMPMGGEMTGITCTCKDLPRKDYELTYKRGS